MPLLQYHYPGYLSWPKYMAEIGNNILHRFSHHMHDTLM